MEGKEETQPWMEGDLEAKKKKRRTSRPRGFEKEPAGRARMGEGYWRGVAF